MIYLFGTVRDLHGLRIPLDTPTIRCGYSPSYSTAVTDEKEIKKGAYRYVYNKFLTRGSFITTRSAKLAHHLTHCHRNSEIQSVCTPDLGRARIPINRRRSSLEQLPKHLVVIETICESGNRSAQ